MKKMIVSLFLAAAVMLGVVGCEPIESSYSMNATYAYSLRAQFAPKVTEIGLPSIQKAQYKVDSFLSNYALNNNLGIVRTFAAGGTTPFEMQSMMHSLIKKTFDSLVLDVRKIDFDKVLDSCSAFYGGSMRIVYEVTPFAAPTSLVVRDTIVESQRLNFMPAIESRWSTEVEGEKYFEYVFDENSEVVLIHSGGDEPTLYKVDPTNGVFTVDAVNVAVPIPQHTLTFQMNNNKPCLLSSMNDKLYFLK